MGNGALFLTINSLKYYDKLRNQIQYILGVPGELRIHSLKNFTSHSGGLNRLLLNTLRILTLACERRS